MNFGHLICSNILSFFNVCTQQWFLQRSINTTQLIYYILQLIKSFSVFSLGMYVNTSSFSSLGHIDPCVLGTFNLGSMCQRKNLTFKVSSHSWHLINVWNLNSLKCRNQHNLRLDVRKNSINFFTKKLPWRNQWSSQY